MESNTKLSLLVALLTIICIVMGVQKKQREPFVHAYQHPHGSEPEQRKRGKTDQLLTTLASRIEGTKKTPIYLIDNFLSPDVCQKIIKSMKDHLTNSPLTRQDPNDPYFRTSETGYFTRNPFHLSIENKICNLLQIPPQYSESSQVQHYKERNEFKLHYDWFDHIHDKDYWSRGQRTWTAMIYLNDVQGGGHTKFPKVQGDLVPKKGQIVLWSNLEASGLPDYDTLHQGSPVTGGEKWIVTKWFLDKK